MSIIPSLSNIAMYVIAIVIVTVTSNILLTITIAIMLLPNLNTILFFMLRHYHAIVLLKNTRKRSSLRYGFLSQEIPITNTS